VNIQKFFLLVLYRSESDIPVSTVETDQLEQPEDKEDRTTPPSEPQLQDDSDGSAAVVNTSFSVDELTAKLRKSLTLDDQPNIESLAAEVQSPAEAEPQSDSAGIAADVHPADDSSTFFDCENKSFVEKVVVGPEEDIADNIVLGQSKADEPDIAPVSETDKRRDSESAEVDENMADNVDLPRSPPIAVTRGSYNINWDELDENTDPFTLEKGLSKSPPRSPVVPACVGAGDGNPVAEIDPFKASRRLTNSPPATAAASVGSPAKKSQRRSINNNVPEPVADTVVSSVADSVEQSDAMDDVSIVSEKKTPSENVCNDKQPEVLENEATTECLNTAK